MNKYLLKVAGMPGTYMTAARKKAVESLTGNTAKTAHSGLVSGPNVSIAQSSLKPRVVQNRTGMYRGALMNKIAEIVVNPDKSLPYRRRVEVAIFKGNKVLLTVNKDKDSGDAWYGFPGGGTEGDKDEVAAEKECLEEVGIAVKDLKRTDVFNTSEGISAKAGRQEKYRGSKTRMFTALYDGKDDSVLGKDDDAVKYVWKEKAEAITLLKKNKVDPTYRVKVVEEYWPSQ